MMHNFENNESVEDTAGNAWKLGNSRLGSHPLHNFRALRLCIHHK